MCVIIVESASLIRRICRFYITAAPVALLRLFICQCNKTAYSFLSPEANLDVHLASDFVGLTSVTYYWEQQGRSIMQSE